MSETITNVLNPGVNDEALENYPLEDAVSHLASGGYEEPEDVDYRESFDVEDDRYGEVKIDPEKGAIKVEDGLYDEVAQEMVALGVEVKDEDDLRRAVAVVDTTYDDVNTSAIVYEDGEVDTSGIDENIASSIYDVVGGFWEGLQEEENTFRTELEDPEFTVELVDDVRDYFEDDMEGSEKKEFMSTLQKLANRPEETARNNLAGNEVSHKVNQDKRLYARVDDSEEVVTVFLYGDHDDRDIQNRWRHHAG